MRKPKLAIIWMLWICLLAATVHAAEEYRLGAGDVVKVTVYNNPDLTTEAQIAEDGAISFPLIGKVTLAGLSKSAAEASIARLLVEGRFLKQAQVNLLISDYRSQKASVLGEVNKPGKYTIGPASTVTDLIAQAGGISEKGSHVVTVIRQGKDGAQAKEEIDLHNVLANGRAAPNMRVGNEDIVFVPPTPVFYIYGEVQKPGAYPLNPNLTVRQALSVGGGLTVRGTERGLRISRRGPDGGVRTIAAGLGDPVQAGDVVQVKESLF